MTLNDLDCFDSPIPDLRVDIRLVKKYIIKSLISSRKSDALTQINIEMIAISFGLNIEEYINITDYKEVL